MELTPETQTILEIAGWSADRQVETTLWRNAIEHVGYAWFPAIEDALSLFGGLTVSLPHGHPIAEDRCMRVTLGGDFMREGMYQFTLDLTPMHAPAWNDPMAWIQRDYIQAHGGLIAPLGMYTVWKSTTIAATTLFLMSNGILLRAGGTQMFPNISNGPYPFLGLLGMTLNEGLNTLIQEQLLYWSPNA